MLLAAEAWGVPPWDIVPGPKRMWLARWTVLQNERAKAVKPNG